MRVRYRKRALAQLNKIFDYLNERNPAAAKAVTERIRASISYVADYPFMGHDTDREGVRMHAVVDYPYLIFYRVYPKREEVRVVRICHRARRHPGFQEDFLVFAAGS